MFAVRRPALRRGSTTGAAAVLFAMANPRPIATFLTTDFATTFPGFLRSHETTSCLAERIYWPLNLNQDVNDLQE
jgi:hypothetical protein